MSDTDDHMAVEVEALTDESGTAYCVRLDLGREVVRSKWMRLASAEKLARTLREKFAIDAINEARRIPGSQS